jgi:hypothetical protein
MEIFSVLVVCRLMLKYLVCENSQGFGEEEVECICRRNWVVLACKYCFEDFYEVFCRKY